MELTIGSKSIRMKDGLYCLNDLHKASGGDPNNAPSQWVKNKQTKDFLQTMEISLVKVEGRGGISVSTLTATC